MSEYSIKDKVAIVGVGETTYYKRGQASVSEFRLACEAIIKAADDAGIEPGGHFEIWTPLGVSSEIIGRAFFDNPRACQQGYLGARRLHRTLRPIRTGAMGRTAHAAIHASVQHQH